MKKWFAFMLAMVFALSVMAGCGARGGGEEEGTQGGEDGKIVVKFSHVVAKNTPKGKAAVKFEKLAEKYTDGKVDVQVFPNASLYDDDEVLAAIQQNSVQLAAPATSKVSKLFPEWTIFDFPFAFPNVEAVQKAMESEEIGGKLFNMLKEKDLLGLAMWDNGFKQMTLDSHPLIKPEDFEGESFRIMSSDVLEAQFEALGANPQKMSFSEVYTALEQGVINGQENTLSNIYSKKFHEVQNYMTISNHGYLGYGVITNPEFWNGLPDDVRKGMEKAMDETTTWVRQNSQQINQDCLEKIKEDGTLKEIHKLTPEEKQAWMEATDKVYQQFEDKVGKDLIEAVKELRK